MIPEKYFILKDLPIVGYKSIVAYSGPYFMERSKRILLTSNILAAETHYLYDYPAII